MRCESGFCIPKYVILHSHRRENVKSYIYSCVANIIQYPIVELI
jgi:hypothetical protein